MNAIKTPFDVIWSD